MKRNRGSQFPLQRPARGIIELMLPKAVALHQAGQIVEAKRLYELILREVPDNFDALHLLGVVAFQSRRFDEAQQLIAKAIKFNRNSAAAYNNLANALFELKRPAEALVNYDAAIRLKPDYFSAYGNRGRSLHALDRLEEALASYERAIALRPDFAEAHNNRGNVLKDLKRPELALASYERAIALRPDFAEAHNNRGMVLTELKRIDEAIASYEKAIALNPRLASDDNNRELADHRRLTALERELEKFDDSLRRNPACAEDHSDRGLVLQALNRLDEALDSYNRAIALKPDFAPAYYNRGNVLHAMKRLDEAAASFDRAIALKPDFAAAYNNRGHTLEELDRLDEALASCDGAIALKPDYANAHYNRGNALRRMGRVEEAAISYERAIALAPDDAESYNNRGIALEEAKRPDEAIDSYSKAIALRPDYVAAHVNRGRNFLVIGEFEKGWRDSEWRDLQEGIVKPSFRRPLWLGDQEISGRTLLVSWERGFGDTIQFCRYVDLLIQRGVRVLFAPQKPLRALMRGLGDRFEIVDVDTKLDYDFHCPLMSLPLALRTNLETIPNQTPYLQAQPDRIEKWADKIGSGGFKIGICWQGNTGNQDTGRSFPLAEFLGISNIPNVRLISIHKGHGVSQLETRPRGMRVETLGEEFDAGPDAFLDTAAVVKICDLVITSDTSVAHLAGALGAPTWVALKRVAEWRWLLDRRDSPWYPTMRLFRQPVRGDWKSVFAEIESELRSLLNV